MSTSTLRLHPLPALRLAQVSGEVDDAGEIGAMVEALSETLTARLAAAGAAVLFSRTSSRGRHLFVRCGRVRDFTIGLTDSRRRTDGAGKPIMNILVYFGISDRARDPLRLTRSARPLEFSQ